MQGDTVSVERVIKAPAREIFALLADAGRHASFDGSGTVEGADATSIPLELGSTFSMRMRGRPETMFLPYTMNNEVIESSRIAASPGSPPPSVAWSAGASGATIERRPRAARWFARRGTCHGTGSA